MRTFAGLLSAFRVVVLTAVQVQSRARKPGSFARVDFLREGAIAIGDEAVVGDRRTAFPGIAAAPMPPWDGSVTFGVEFCAAQNRHNEPGRIMGPTVLRPK